MKKIILSILIFSYCLVPRSGIAQNGCYNQFLQEGIKAFDNLNYPTAISNFEAAAICDDKPRSDKVLNDWLKKAKDRFINELQEQKATIEAQKSSLETALEETEIQRQRADSARLIAEGARLALLASNETETGNDTAALILAFKANQILFDKETPSIKYAFGQAAHNYFLKSYSPDDQLIRKIIAIPQSPNFLVELDNGGLGTINPNQTNIKILGQHGDLINSYDFNNGQTLTTSNNNEAKIWELTKDTSINLKGHSGALVFGVFSENNQTVLTGSRDKTANLWEGNGQLIATLEGHKGTIYEGHFSKNGQVLTRSSDGKVLVWNAAGDLQAIISGHEAYIYSAIFSPDGQHVLTASADGTAKLWSTDGALISSIQPDESAVKEAIFSPDGQIILTRTLHNEIKLFSLNGQLKAALKGHRELISKVKFNQQGDKILTCSNDHTAKVWNLNGDMIITLNHNAPIIEANFSADEMLILSTSSDGQSKLWDQNGDLLQTIKSNIKPAVPAVFSADNQFIAIIPDASTINIWPIPSIAYKKLSEEKVFPNSTVVSLEKKYNLKILPLN